VPALCFAGLGLIVKGERALADARRAAAESRINLQLICFNLILVVPAITFASNTISVFVDHNGLYLLRPEVWQHLPQIAVVAIAVFIGDFAGYWRHRLEHTALLWPSHAVHHSDTEMTWLTLERFHPINRISTFVIDAGVLLLLGLPPYAVLANNLVRHYYGYFIHADLPWTYGRLGKIFVSPAMHRWHHSTERAAFDTNYATVFSLFDWAFGTWRVPGPCAAPLGVTDRIAPTLLGYLTYALQPRAYLRLFRRAPGTSDGPAPQ
jgi:sterol desaturase/sphingolipid hydroxylase (fatty acid hydroxylase superfamily)